MDYTTQSVKATDQDFADLQARASRQMTNGVSVSLEQLAENLSQVEKTTSALRERLACVLLQPDTANDIPHDTPAPARSTLAMELTNQAERLVRLCIELEAIHSHLDL